MMDATELHTRAMQFYDAALAARRNGDEALFRQMVDDAFAAEAEAADLFAASEALEPTRSILYRSAATIAVAGGAFDKALRFAAAGLAGPGAPAEIRRELVALVKDANFRLHVFETDGVVIPNESLTLSLEGEAIGNGMARQDVFKLKLNSLVTLLARTYDRVRGLPFGDARMGRIAPVYVGPPFPGSFAIELRIGDQRQPDIEGIPQVVEGDAVLDEVVECFKEFQDGNLDALRTRINSEEYFTNFIGLGRSLQPDGTKITSVELIGNLKKGLKRVRLATPRRAILRQRPIIDEPITREVTGLLRVAEKRGEGKEHVEILDDNGAWHVIHVPSALMTDVVRPLWDCRVTITGRAGKRGVLELEFIQQA